MTSHVHVTEIYDCRMQDSCFELQVPCTNLICDSFKKMKKVECNRLYNYQLPTEV